MYISTKGRYALRVLVDLASINDSRLVPLAEIANRQEISLKYLERIMPLLTKAGYVNGTSGKNGGYCLSKSPNKLFVGEILRLTEGTLAPVSCLACEENVCSRKDKCKTVNLWASLENKVNSYLDSVSVSDVVNGKF